MMKIKNSTEANGRVFYELLGDTKSEATKIGQIFIDIWGPGYAPATEPPTLGGSGTWRSLASRAAERDLSLYDQAELKDAVPVIGSAAWTGITTIHDAMATVAAAR
jgi:arginase family enzyme